MPLNKRLRSRFVELSKLQTYGCYGTPGQNDPLEFADLLSKDPRINSSLSRVAQNAVECEKRN